MIFLQILFFFCLCLLLYTYAVYPAMVRWLADKRKALDEKSAFDSWPRVVVLLSAYNEEQIIEEKIDSVFNTDYPLEQLTMLIGSDCSSDNTDALIRKKKEEYPGIVFHRMAQRSGKANVLNQLRKEAQHLGDILLLTDANVLFRKKTLTEIIRPFKDEKVGQVAANIQNYQVTNEEIGSEEEYYIGRENQTKHAEGVLWGSMMGAFGACYAIRAALMP
ncbi:MAG TPA: glycosyltransferase, partial [Saprospiraceae bacterium]|nr:glycosyltransferase [Saprospiraceae bacterium]